MAPVVDGVPPETLEIEEPVLEELPPVALEPDELPPTAPVLPGASPGVLPGTFCVVSDPGAAPEAELVEGYVDDG